MFILYGTKTFKNIEGHTKENMSCDHCNNVTKWQLVDMWTWFTLFFIPIFPMKKKTVLICPYCEYGIKVTGKNKEEIMQMVELD